MSFIDKYLSKYQLPSIPESANTTLNNLEEVLNKQAETKDKFEATLNEFGPKIADIVGRFSVYFKSLPPVSVSSIVGCLRFVINIGVEVYQVIEEMQSHIVSPEMDKEQASLAKMRFGQDCVYFIWKTVDPLKNKMNWVPFKTTIEKKLVMWLSNMAIQFAFDFFKVNSQMAVLDSKQSNTEYIKTI